MLCPKCAAENDENAAVCAACGESFQKDEAAPQAGEAGSDETALDETVEEAQPASVLAWIAAIIALVPWLMMAIAARMTGDIDVGPLAVMLKIYMTPYVAIASLVLFGIAIVGNSLSSKKKQMTSPAMLVIILGFGHIAYTIWLK
jgi:hypothetical protein